MKMPFLGCFPHLRPAEHLGVPRAEDTVLPGMHPAEAASRAWEQTPRYWVPTQRRRAFLLEQVQWP